MMTGRLGFSKRYLELHWQRMVRSAVSATSEAATMQLAIRSSGVTRPVPISTLRQLLTDAVFYFLRLKDLQQGQDTAYRFQIELAVELSILYRPKYTQQGDEVVDTNFLIYDSKRDDPDHEAATSIVTDGNQRCSRKLHCNEKNAKVLRRLRGKPKGTTSSASSKVLKKPCACLPVTGCKDKTAMSRPNRSGGLYLTMNGSTAKGPNRIMELREVLNNEDNELRELSFKAVKKSSPGLKLFVHDLVCKCNFLDKFKIIKLLDKFHARNHTNHLCQTKYNPKTPANLKVLKKHKVTNTSICETMNRTLNRHRHAMYLNRARYRAFWRHFCIFYNAEPKEQKASMLPPYLAKKK